jgi:RNA polymerase sigma-70 factor (ECF subfamily)
MSPDSKPAKVPAAPSGKGTSTPRPDADGAQLSGQDGVSSDVSSVAMDRGMLAMAAGVEAQAELASRGSDDAEVMLRVKAGDETAFAYLVQKYRRPMVSFMYRMSHNAAAAEDLAQEVFLRVYRSREGYEASAKFTTWLYRIASNLAVNHARDTRHERPENMVSLDEPDEDTGLTVDVPDGSATAEETIMKRQRTAVIMHKYQQMDYRQIAEVLKLSESATKSLLFRAYETLRGQLKEFV